MTGKSCPIPFSLWLALLVLSLALPPFTAAAQDSDAPDPPGTVYGSGYLPSPPAETRGIRSVPKFRSFLPSSVDLSGQLPAVGQQGEIGSCVAWAAGYAARSYYVSRFEGRSLRDTGNVPSPAYIYGAVLDADGSRNCNRGMTIPQALELLKSGAVSLSAMPYDRNRCSPPPAAVKAKAKHFRIQDWLLIDVAALDSIKGELANGHPIVFAMQADRAFQDLRRHRVYNRTRPHQLPGTHAMAIVGYDETRQAFLLINSWGRGWGNSGYAWLSYETFSKDGLNAFAMRPINEGKTETVEESKPVPPQPKPVAEDVKPKPPAPEPPKPQPVVEDVEPAPGPQPVAAFEAECAKVSVVQRNGRRVAEGFVGRQDDLDRFRTQAEATKIDLAVDLRPWPQCEALLTLEKPLAAGDKPAVKLLNGPSLKQGDAAALEVISPDKPAHLHVAYIQDDGSVVHLVQSDAFNQKTYDGRKTLSFGDGKDGRALFKVSAPFGREMVLVLASRAPLFAKARPQKESERDFLTALRKALLWKPEPGGPEREVAAAFAALETRKE